MTATEIETEKTISEYDMLITDEIDFRVELRAMKTVEEDTPLDMPEHKATIRINPDGTKQPLWVVGSKYEVVDHREIIKHFAEALNKSDIEAEVDYKVYKGGCRIYSIFTLNNTYRVNGKTVKPFFALTTSHDGSLRVGFMMGAKLDKKRYISIAKTLYGSSAKHTKGINIEKTLVALSKALEVFTNDVIPMWERMDTVTLNPEQVKSLVDNAIKKKIISDRKARDLPFVRVDGKGKSAKIFGSSYASVWEVYTGIITEVSKVPEFKGATEERAFWRNTDASEYFTKMMAKGMDLLKKTTETKEEESEDK